jgi:hypothetical protein
VVVTTLAAREARAPSRANVEWTSADGDVLEIVEEECLCWPDDRRERRRVARCL